MFLATTLEKRSVPQQAALLPGVFERQEKALLGISESSASGRI